METTEKSSGIITILKSEYDWLQDHASFKDGVWRCDITDAEIIMKPVQHPIWENGVEPIGRETKTVYHLYCPRCQKEPEFTPGSPIERDDLIEAPNG